MARMDGMARALSPPRAGAPHDARALLDDGLALRAAAQALGYLFVPALLAPHELEPLRRDVLAICARLRLLAAPRTAVPRARRGARLEPDVSAAWIELQQRVARSQSFTALACHPRIVAVLQTLFSSRPVPHRGDVCRVFLPGAPELATPPHQDLHFLRRSGFHEPHRIWSAWLPLEDGSPQLGGLALIPGSHHGGLRPHRAIDGRGEQIAGSDSEPWIGAPMRRGDVVFLSCLTVHRGLPNRTPDRLRISVDYRYQPEAHATPAARGAAA